MALVYTELQQRRLSWLSRRSGASSGYRAKEMAGTSPAMTFLRTVGGD
jgi:hypothetical protein